MRIAVSVESDDLEGRVSPFFGRCPGFLILEVEGKAVKSHRFIDNPARNAMGGAGIVAAKAVVEKKVEAVISGNLGPNAGLILEQSGVKAFQAEGKSVRQAVKALAEGRLEEIKGSSVGPDFGREKGA